MAIIYKITNLLNNKVYIGQTKTPLQQRMYKHYSRANCDDATGIDGAIRKYGKENFSVEVVCNCSELELDRKEQEYIAYYDSYNNGYNLTLGGQGKETLSLYDEEMCIQKFHELKSIKAAAEYIGCCEKTLSNILQKNGIDTYFYSRVIGVENLKRGTEKSKRKIRIIELNKTFNSGVECGRWLIDNGYSAASSNEQAAKGLLRAVRGERQSYCGLHFEYADNR